MVIAIPPWNYNHSYSYNHKTPWRYNNHGIITIAILLYHSLRTITQAIAMAPLFSYHVGGTNGIHWCYKPSGCYKAKTAWQPHNYNDHKISIVMICRND